MKKVEEYIKEFGGDEVADFLSFLQEKASETGGDFSDSLNMMKLLLPFKLCKDTVFAVFLSDLYVDGVISDTDVLNRFGEGVHSILFSLKKLDSLDFVEHDKSARAEVLRRMFLTMAKDLRAVIIWLSWKAVKMRRLSGEVDSHKRLTVARQAMNIYAPIAARLGIYSIRTLLEDLAFKHMDPAAYDDIEIQIKELGGAHKKNIERLTSDLKNFLLMRGIEARVEGRIKSVYGLYRKLKKKNLNTVSDIYDFFAIRIILPVEANGSVDHLYSVLGLIHSEWKPFSHKFKDYISVPKPNGYKSLHTVVSGLGEGYFDKPVEIQIRDEDMHRESECGMASHWVYKTASLSASSSNVDSQSEWIKGLEKIHEFFRTGFGDIKDVDIDIFKDMIFVLTPKGEVKDLPQGSVPIDFAYNIHTDLGNRCAMVKVNGMVVPLDYELKNGDVVEIITKRTAEPKLKWLSIVKTPIARSRIKSWFS